MSISYGARKIDMVEKLGCTEMANCIRLKAQLCQKYTSPEKSLKLKLFGIEFHSKKSSSAYVYLPLEWS